LAKDLEIGPEPNRIKPNARSMMHSLNRWLILALLVMAFVAVSSVLTALITFKLTDSAWKAAIILCGYCIAVVPVASLLLLRRLTRSPLARVDSFVSATLMILALPLPVLIYTHIVPAVAGRSFSDPAIRLLTASVVICTIVGIWSGLRLTKRSSQALTD
jgi:hypothetical protein